MGKRNIKIGVIGLGTVGTAVWNGFKSKRYSLTTYDKAVNSKLPDFNQAEITFVCVPTPSSPDGKQDISHLLDVLNLLPGYKGIVVIKSTVLPGTTQRLQDMHPKLQMVCNPEFLAENNALEDFLHPDKIIIGYTAGHHPSAQKVASIFRDGWKDVPIKVVPSNVAEMAKYMINNHYSLLVIYANQIYDLCKALGINYEAVKDCFLLDKYVVPGNFDVFYRGKKTRGFGGKCLPKDLAALTRLAQDSGMHLRLLETVELLNNELKEGK